MKVAFFFSLSFFPFLFLFLFLFLFPFAFLVLILILPSLSDEVHLADDGVLHAFVLKSSGNVASKVAPVLLRHSRSSTDLSDSVRLQQVDDIRED